MNYDFLANRGEMSERIRALDWAATPLGPTGTWSPTLRTALGIMLGFNSPVCLLWGPGLLLLYNDAFIPLLGNQHPSALGQPAREVWHETWATLGPQIDAMQAKNSPAGKEGRLVLPVPSAAPQKTFFQFSASPVPDDQGRVEGFFCVAEREPADPEREALLAREQAARLEAEAAWAHFRSLFESAPGLYLALRPDTLEITGASEAYLRATMTELSNIVGKNVFEVFPDNPNDPSADGMRNLRASLLRVQQDHLQDVMPLQRYPIRRPKERGGGFEDRYWSPINSPVMDAAGRLVAIIHRVEDVTEFVRLKQQEDAWEGQRTLPPRREQMEAEIVVRSRELQRAKEELRERQERLEAALNGSGAGTFRWTIPTNLLDFDRNLDCLFGLPPGRTLRSLDEFLAMVHPDERPAVLESCERCAREGADFDLEYRVLWPDGSIHWLYDKGTTYRDAAGKPFHVTGMCLDITERKKNEQALREAAGRFRFMAESMPQKIFTAKANGQLDYLNAQWVEFTGLPFERIHGSGWLQVIHPEDVEENTRRWKHSVQTGEDFQYELRLRRHDGVYRWHLARARAMRDAHGNILMWVGSNTDIDDHKRWGAELERAVHERTARLEETIAELEAFSYSISHDMRAPLRSMQSFAALLSEEYTHKIDPQGQDYLRRIITSASRMDHLIKDVLNYSRLASGKLPLEPVQLSALLRGIIESYPNLHSPQAQVTVQDPIPPVLANEAALTQCLSNLLGNAVKFVAPGQQPKVHVWAEQHSSFIRLFVQDNGIGIPPYAQDRIFAIFQRLSRDYEGTGIGLAIVKKAVERMGGEVGLTSEPGKGSTFWLDLQPLPPQT